MRPLPPEFGYLAGKIASSAAHAEFFPLRPTDRVVNLGFGDGPQAVHYAGRFSEMVGVDVNAERLERARRMLAAMGVGNVRLVEGNVEALPFPDASFEAALACDIIEHVEHPDRFLAEMRRVLVPGGRALITVPAMHDRFTDAVSGLGRLLGKKAAPHPEGWHPDHHQHEMSVGAWTAVIARAGFRVVRRRATTLFPPLHLYGVPRFWFTVRPLRAADRLLCRIPGLRLLGQTMMLECVSAPR